MRFEKLDLKKNLLILREALYFQWKNKYRPLFIHSDIFMFPVQFPPLTYSATYWTDVIWSFPILRSREISSMRDFVMHWIFD